MWQKKRIGSIVCPKCGKLISVNAPECIHCGRKNSGGWELMSFLDNFFSSQFRFIDIVTAICIILYILSLILDPAAIARQSGFLNILSPSSIAVAKMGATGNWAIANGRLWTYISAIYLHGGLLHIFFNILWIRQIAPMVKDLYGTSRLISIFTISGAVGFVISSMFTGLTIGASGAIFGLLAALIYYGKTRGGSFGTDVYMQVGKWAIILFVFGLLWPHVDNYAHTGGFVAGLVCAMIFDYNEKAPEKQYHKILAFILVCLTIGSFILNLLTIDQVR